MNEVQEKESKREEVGPQRKVMEVKVKQVKIKDVKRSRKEDLKEKI